MDAEILWFQGENFFNNLYYEKNLNAVFVEDTTCALQDLAACYLNMLGIIKVAVTGSTGKTTTKDRKSVV